MTIFAFGMTGSGKSHTISGDSADAGIVPRSVNYIFESLTKTAAQKPNQIAMVCLTYVELYNNHLYDLIAEPSSNPSDSNSNLKIHEHPQRGIYLTGSSGIRTPVSSLEEAIAFIEKGNRIRVILFSIISVLSHCGISE